MDQRNTEGADDTDGIVSWSAHRIPAGTPVRYVVGAAHDDAPIRLLLGAADQVELEMPLAAVEPVITALRHATRDVDAQRARADPAPPVF